MGRTSNVDRARIARIARKEPGVNWQTYATMANIKKRTGYNIVRIAKREGRTHALQRGRKPRRWKGEYTRHLIEMIRVNCLLSLNSMQSAIFNRFGQSFCTSTIAKYLMAFLAITFALRTLSDVGVTVLPP